MMRRVNWIPALVLFCVVTGLTFLWDFSGDDEDSALVIMLLTLPVMVLSIVFTAILHYKCWNALPEHFRSTTPGKAVGYLFIPFFNFYWCFPSLKGLAHGFAEFGRDRQDQRFEDKTGIGTALAVVFVCDAAVGTLGVLGFESGLIEFVGMATNVLGLIVFVLYYQPISAYANFALESKPVPNIAAVLTGPAPAVQEALPLAHAPAAPEIPLTDVQTPPAPTSQAPVIETVPSHPSGLPPVPVARERSKWTDMNVSNWRTWVLAVPILLLIGLVRFGINQVYDGSASKPATSARVQATTAEPATTAQPAAPAPTVPASSAPAPTSIPAAKPVANVDPEVDGVVAVGRVVHSRQGASPARPTHVVFGTAADPAEPWLNLRECATTQCNVIAKLPDGTGLRILSPQGRLYEVEVVGGTFDGLHGYVHSKWVRPSP